jgi:hypothetical protein
MDWLSNHGAQIDCGENTVTIRNLDGGRIVYQGDKHTRMEAELQLNSLEEVKPENPGIKDILGEKPQQKGRRFL